MKGKWCLKTNNKLTMPMTYVVRTKEVIFQ